MPLIRTLFHRILVCVWLSQSLAAPALATDLSLPDVGSSAGVHLSPTQERRLGQAFMRSIRGSKKLENDPVLTDYIQSLGHKLARHDKSAGSYNFFLVREPSINAFAGPGGNIGINTGLILESETESELAAVLAHEIAHVSQRHIARMVEAANNLSLPAAGVLLAALLLGAAGAGNAAMAAAVGGQAALLQEQINFTRGNEQEADRIGMQILADANYDPRAMPVFFQKLGRANRTSASMLPEFLRTHPVTTSRISDTLSRAERYPYRQHPEDIRYHLTRAALKAAGFTNSRAAVEYFESTLRDGRYRNASAERYGYALALHRAGRLEAARREIDSLLASNPRQMEYIVASARLFLEQGRSERALDVLSNGLSSHPGNYPLSLISAQTMLGLGKSGQASSLLRQLLRSHPDDPEVHRLLARAAADTGHQGESHEHLAEYHYAIGELEAAERQLEIATRAPDLDFYGRSRVEARLKEVAAEVKELRRSSGTGRDTR